MKHPDDARRVICEGCLPVIMDQDACYECPVATWQEYINDESSMYGEVDQSEYTSLTKVRR